MLRLYHPQTGERLPTSDEEAQARRAAEARAAQLEAEVARLRAELARLAGAQAALESSSSEEA